MIKKTRKTSRLWIGLNVILIAAIIAEGVLCLHLSRGNTELKETLVAQEEKLQQQEEELTATKNKLKKRNTSSKKRRRKWKHSMKSCLLLLPLQEKFRALPQMEAVYLPLPVSWEMWEMW